MRLDPRTIGIGKFGRNPDIDTAADEDIWSQGGTYTFLTSAATLYASSSEDEDIVEVTVVGLDANGLEVTRTVNLTGHTQVALPGTWLRVYRAYNAGSVPFDGDVYIAEQDTTTDGVPDTASKIKAKIDQTAQQTLMAITTVPAIVGNDEIRYGYIADFFATAKRNGSAARVDLDLFVRSPGGVFLSKSSIGLNTNVESDIYRPFERYIRIDPLSDVKVRAGTTANNVDIAAEFTIFYEKS